MTTAKRPLATAEQVQTEASGYILCKLGDFLWAGEPRFDAQRQLWTVPIHSRALPAEETLGAITLNARGKIILAPSRRELQQSVSSSTSDAPSPAVSFQPAFALRGNDQTNPEPLVLPDLPENPVEIGQEVLADPEMQEAYCRLKYAFADPQLRQSVLAALEAMARAARPQQADQGADDHAG